MTPDNAPTVITAAEFVSGGYAQRVAAGECVVYALTFKVQAVSREVKGYFIEWVPLNDKEVDPCDYFEADSVPQLHIEWTATATPATDELASLRAQVARYRAALERMKRHIASAEKLERKIYDRSPELVLYETLTRIADAALAETEEA